MNSDCVWQKVLQLNILCAGFEMKDILYGGPELLRSAGRSLENTFWKETILALADLCEETPAAHPLLFFHVFNNKIFSSRGVCLDKNDFPDLWHNSVIQAGDYYDCSTSPPTLLSIQDLKEKYDVRLNFLQYLRIKTMLELAATNINSNIYHKIYSDLQRPRLPLIYKLISAQKKGCSSFYKTLRASELSKISMASCEEKWHSETGMTFSPGFWDKVWNMSKKSIVQNKMKWVTIQINRHILPTNYTVNKYKPNVDPGCSLCTNSHAEKLKTLLWDCQVVQDFWKIVHNLLSAHFPGFILGVKEAIFGDLESEGSSVQNTILLLSRQFIWRQKFTSKTLDEVQFINFIINELKNLFNAQFYKGKVQQFIHDWQTIFDHFGVEYGSLDEFIL